MPVISVRISEEQLRELLRYGSISQAVREGLKLYLNRRKSEEALSRLERLQSINKPRTTAKEEVKLIKEDRAR
jgi:Arc/MetJ-type ribon-helix-helix transcriptional regulator